METTAPFTQKLKEVGGMTLRRSGNMISKDKNTGKPDPRAGSSGMSTITEFIMKNDVETTRNLVSLNEIDSIQNELGVSFGDQLKIYVLEFGYLAFGSVEFYGINSRQSSESDMVRQTLYLHKYYPFTKPFIALENRGDGDYYVVDSRDNVFEFIPEQNNELKDTGTKLFDYILKRFEAER
jgi:hypothetical protein